MRDKESTPILINSHAVNATISSDEGKKKKQDTRDDISRDNGPCRIRALSFKCHVDEHPPDGVFCCCGKGEKHFPNSQSQPYLPLFISFKGIFGVFVLGVKVPIPV